MNKKILRVVGAGVIVCIAMTVFAAATQDSETETIKMLLQKRTYVMENVLLGKITYDEGKKQLKEIESDKLYSNDIKALNEYKNTDFARTEKMEIIYLEKKSQIYDKSSYEGKIKWTESYGREKSVETHIYEIGVSKKGDEYRLISFEIQ